MEMVDCTPNRARITLSACQRMWNAARKRAPAVWESGNACRTCVLGALRNGGTPRTGFEEVVSDCCPRCGRTGARKVAHDLCVSCYNRQAEFLRGRTRRGKPCNLRLGCVSVGMVREGALSDPRRTLARDASEVIVAQSKTAPVGTVFGWRPRMLIAQGELFPAICHRRSRSAWLHA